MSPYPMMTISQKIDGSRQVQFRTAAAPDEKLVAVIAGKSGKWEPRGLHSA